MHFGLKACNGLVFSFGLPPKELHTDAPHSCAWWGLLHGEPIRWLRCTPAISGWLKHWEHLGFQLLGFMCYNFLTWIYFYYLLFLGASSHTPGTWWFKPFLIWSLAPWLLPLRPIKWPFGWESMHPYRGNGPGFGQRLLLSLLWIWGQWLLKNDLVARLWQPATKIPKVDRDSKGTNRWKQASTFSWSECL